MQGLLNKKDKIIKPDAINNPEKQEGNKLKSATGTLLAAVNKQHEIITQPAIIFEKIIKLKYRIKFWQAVKK